MQVSLELNQFASKLYVIILVASVDPEWLAC